MADDQSVDDGLPGDFSMVLVAPEIPHNAGAVGRLCVCLGVKLHLIRPLGFRLTEYHVRRAGMDYWAHVDVMVHDDWESFLEAEHPAQLIFSSTHASRSYVECRAQPGCALVFGNESSGLPEGFYERYANHLYRLPMPGAHARSLNLSLSAAIFAYEVQRQLGSAS